MAISTQLSIITLNVFSITIYSSYILKYKKIIKIIITLNINGLNNPIKRHRVAALIKKHDMTLYMMLTRDSLQIKRHIQAESEGVDKKSKLGQQYSYQTKIDLKTKKCKKKIRKDIT